MTEQEFIKNLTDLNITSTPDTLDKLKTYCTFLKDYNKHTNLTALTETKDIYLKHFYDSLTIVKAVNLNDASNLIDIGTGAGFPGMVVKIFFPHLNVYLLDSNNKKTKFLQELQEKISISVNIINDRCENYAKLNLNKFDIVTSRAVANLRILSELGLPLVKKDGLFIALKGNIEEELKDALDTIHLLDSEIINTINFDLYNNDGIRNIVVIKKNKDTLPNKLRPYDKIIKKPLKI